MVAFLCVVKWMSLSNVGKSFHVFCVCCVSSEPMVPCEAEAAPVARPDCFPWVHFIKHLFKSLEEWSLKESQWTAWKSQSQTEILVLLWWVSWSFHIYLFYVWPGCSGHSKTEWSKSCWSLMCLISNLHPIMKPARGWAVRVDPQQQLGGAWWAWHPEVFVSRGLWLQGWGSVCLQCSFASCWRNSWECLKASVWFLERN